MMARCYSYPRRYRVFRISAMMVYLHETMYDSVLMTGVRNQYYQEKQCSQHYVPQYK